jgi:hypothetical protein
MNVARPVRLLVAYDFSVEDRAGVEAPNFYRRAIEHVFPKHGIETSFVPPGKRRRREGGPELASGLLGVVRALLPVAIWVHRHRTQYDVVLGWQANGLLVGLLRRIFHWRSPRVCVVLYALPGNGAGSASLKQRLVRYALGGCDLLLALDRQQAQGFEFALDRTPGTTRSLRYGVADDWYRDCGEVLGATDAASRTIFCPGSAARDDVTLRAAVDDLDVVVERYQLAPGLARVAEEQLTRAKVTTWVNAPYRDYLRSCLMADFVVIPVRNADKPVGLTSLLECMALGKAIVVPRGASTIDYVSHGHSALLYEEGNALELREQILLLLNDAPLRARLGQAARALAFGELGLNSTGGALAEYLIELTGLDRDVGQAPAGSPQEQSHV